MDIQTTPGAGTSTRGATAPADPAGLPAAGADTADTKAAGTGATRSGREADATVRLGSLASDDELLLRGRRAFEQGDEATSIACLERLAAHGRRFADVHYMLGLLHERRGDLPAALARLQEAIRINPAYVEALLALASLHERSGDYDRSQGYAERASQLSRAAAGGLDPTTRGKLANQQAALADALARAGELREAIEEYRRALDRCPTFHDIRHRLAVTLRDAGLPAQAAREFQRILDMQPSLLDSQIQLGLTWYSMGRTPEAIAEWNAVLEKDPGRDAARMYLRLVRGRDRRVAAAVDRDETGNLSASAGTPDEATHGSEVTFRAIPPAPRAGNARGGEISGWSRAELAGQADEMAVRDDQPPLRRADSRATDGATDGGTDET